MKKLNKAIKYLIYVLPVVLFFSYYPLIHFGASESMNFEISLPLIWLVLFDVLAIIIMAKRKILFQDFSKKWIWLLFPAFLTISVLWSLNSLRGILTVGILWFLYFAIYAMFSLKSLFDEEFKKIFLKWFFGSALFMCFLCFLQCVLDLAGVAREWTLMCEGCTYLVFGFPHPNGFAIEPQFMGNLLLAPAIVSAWMIMRKKCVKKMVPCFLIISVTLFLTFSRGAIYAFIVAMIFMTMFLIVREKKGVLKRAGMVWLAMILAFLFTLNLQGVMAAVSLTNDTYGSGVAKVLNHLSLGTIEIRGEKGNSGEVEEVEAVENSVENSEGTSEGIQAVFDGYAEESTNIRMGLSSMALKVWAKDFTTMMFGVGLGGAGQALYVNNLTDSPKEIIQNQYVSLLLEVGIVGIMLMILTLVLIVKEICKRKNFGMALSLAVAYGISLMFFSGLPNALQIYLLPAILILV